MKTKSSYLTVRRNAVINQIDSTHTYIYSAVKNKKYKDLSLTETSFKDSSIKETSFMGGDTDKSSFNNTLLENVDFVDTMFGNTSFTNKTTFKNTKLDSVLFLECSFKNVRFDNVLFNSVSFADCTFHNVQINSSTFEGCVLNRIEFNDVEIERTIFGTNQLNLLNCAYKNEVIGERTKVASNRCFESTVKRLTFDTCVFTKNIYYDKDVEVDGLMFDTNNITRCSTHNCSVIGMTSKNHKDGRVISYNPSLKPLDMKLGFKKYNIVDDSKYGSNSSYASYINQSYYTMHNHWFDKTHSSSSYSISKSNNCSVSKCCHMFCSEGFDVE